LRWGSAGKTPIGFVGRESNMDLFLIAARDCGGGVATILWIIAAILVIGGIVTLIRGAVLYGIVLIIIGLLIGPGGVSIFC
jgi:hypothetical protein